MMGQREQLFRDRPVDTRIRAYMIRAVILTLFHSRELMSSRARQEY